MSFFSKIKQGLGIGTAKAELHIPGQISKDSRTIDGKVVIVAQSAQKVKKIKLVFIERYSTGRGQEKQVKEYELGNLTLDQAFDLQQDERREIDFNLPFKLGLSNNQSLAEEKGALGALGKVAMFATAEKSEYEVKVTADLEGVALDPSDSKSVHLV